MQTICEFLRTHITDMKSFTDCKENTNHLIAHKINMTWFCTVQQNNNFQKLELCKIAECNKRNRYNIAIPSRAPPLLCLTILWVLKNATLSSTIWCQNSKMRYSRSQKPKRLGWRDVFEKYNLLPNHLAFATFIWQGCKQSKATFPSWREHSFHYCHDLPFASHKSIMTHLFLSCSLMSIFFNLQFFHETRATPENSSSPPGSAWFISPSSTSMVRKFGCHQK